MEIALEYEFGKFLECDNEGISFILGGDSAVKWKLYRGLKRFATGKMLSELEEHVYGDDGIVIRADGRQIKAKDIQLLMIDHRESFFEQLRVSKGNMMNGFIESLQDNFEVSKKMDELNDELLRLEILIQEKFSESFTSVTPLIKPFTFADLMKTFLGLSYYEESKEFPLEMMDVATVIDDYCDILEHNLSSTSKETWLWLFNPNSFVNNVVLQQLLERLKVICSESDLLRVFVLSDDCLGVSHAEEDIAKTVLVYQNQQQQLPELSELIKSIERYYPDDFNYDTEQLVDSLYRIFPSVGQEDAKIYLKPKDMLLLKVVSQLVDCPCKEKCKDFSDELTTLEKKFLQKE